MGWRGQRWLARVQEPTETPAALEACVDLKVARSLARSHRGDSVPNSGRPSDIARLRRDGDRICVGPALALAEPWVGDKKPARVMPTAEQPSLCVHAQNPVSRRLRPQLLARRIAVGRVQESNRSSISCASAIPLRPHSLGVALNGSRSQRLAGASVEPRPCYSKRSCASPQSPSPRFMSPGSTSVTGLCFWGGFSQTPTTKGTAVFIALSPRGVSRPPCRWPAMGRRRLACWPPWFALACCTCRGVA